MSMWDAIDSFREQLLREERISGLRDQCLHREVEHSAQQTTFEKVDREALLRKIELVIENVLLSLSSGEAPCLMYSSRSNWDNICYDEGRGLEMSTSSSQTSVRFDSITSVNKFTLTLKVLHHIYSLVQSDTYCTKRDMFYHDPKAFGSQTVLNEIVDNISCMLRVPRWHLHVMATSKGLVAGDLAYMELDGARVDCSQTATGISIPNHVVGITNITSNAKVIILVEKDATFQRLMDENICSKLERVILITGKGVPDMTTRLLVRRLWEVLHLPILALVDADPHGLEIMAIYRFGSMSLAFDAQSLAVPAVRWLGVWPSDIERMKVPRPALLPLSQADEDKARDLLRRPYMSSQPQWKRELETLLQMRAKAEIQCLQSISPTFLTEVYLPNKLRYGGWLWSNHTETDYPAPSV